MRIKYSREITEPVRIGSTLVAFENGISEEVSDAIGNAFLSIPAYRRVPDIQTSVDVVSEPIVVGEAFEVVLDSPPLQKPKTSRRKK